MALKASKENEVNAPELADQIQIGDLMGVLHEVTADMSDMAIEDIYGDLASAACLVQFQELYDYLQQCHSKLKSLRNYRFSTKLASQAKIHDIIMHTKYDVRFERLKHNAVLLARKIDEHDRRNIARFRLNATSGAITSVQRPS